jgi:hypothetical protein
MEELLSTIARFTTAKPQAKKNASEAKPLRRQSISYCLVRLAGFEPTTPWFVAKYSIQLSYSREASKYSTKIAGLYNLAAAS